MEDNGLLDNGLLGGGVDEQLDHGPPSPQPTERSVHFSDVQSGSLRPAAMRVYVSKACSVLGIDAACAGGTWTRKSNLGRSAMRDSLWGPLEDVPPNSLAWPLDQEWVTLETYYCRGDHRVVAAFEVDRVVSVSCRLSGQFVRQTLESGQGACAPVAAN